MKKIVFFSIASALLLAGCGSSKEEKAYAEKHKEVISPVLVEAISTCQGIHNELNGGTLERATQYLDDCSATVAKYEEQKENLNSDQEMTENMKALDSATDDYLYSMQDTNEYYYAYIESASRGQIPTSSSLTSVASKTSEVYEVYKKALKENE